MAKESPMTPKEAAIHCETDVECGGFSFSMGGMNLDLPMEGGVSFYRYIVPVYGSMVNYHNVNAMI